MMWSKKVDGGISCCGIFSSIYIYWRIIRQFRVISDDRGPAGGGERARRADVVCVSSITGGNNTMISPKPIVA